jgi:hypothetical protein
MCGMHEAVWVTLVPVVSPAPPRHVTISMSAFLNTNLRCADIGYESPQIRRTLLILLSNADETSSGFYVTEELYKFLSRMKLIMSWGG